MATIKIDKQKNGKYTIRVWSKRDDFGKRRSKCIKDISGIVAARKIASETSYELEESNINKDLTFCEADDLYFAERKSKVSPSTLNGLFKNERLRIRDYFGNVKIKNINTKMVQDYIDKEQAKGLKKKTVQNRVWYLKAVLNWAVNQDFLEYNRIKKLAFRDDEEEFEPTTLSLSQTAKILSKMRTDYYNLYIPTLISVLTSARRSEALGLTWDDIDFENNIINFRKSLITIDGKSVLKHNLKTKTSKRQVPMANFLREELLYHKAHFCLRDFDCQVCSNVFIGEISPDYITHSLHDMVLNTFHIDMREHDLRHTFSQIIYENEDLLLDKSKMMGHSNTITTSKIYTKKTISDHFCNIVNAMGEILREECAKNCATI